MKNTPLTLLFLAALMLALLPLATPHPAAAQAQNPLTYLEPGFYRGFIALTLHSDAISPLEGGGGTANVEYEGAWIQRNGLLEFNVGEDQVAYGEINLVPIQTVMEYFDSIKTPVGNCTWGASWTGEMRHSQATAGKKIPISNSFRFTLPYQDIRTFSFDLYKAEGSLKGCDKRVSNVIWKSLMTYAEFHSKQVTEMYLEIKSHPNPGVVNGTCVVSRWDTTESVTDGPLVGGTLTRDTPVCNWNAWMDSPYLSGWTWSDAVKRKGRK